jgi:hypothetical protein
VIESELSQLRYSLRCDLQRNRFAFIPTDKANYFERDDVFGKEFHSAASCAINEDIKAAGNCVAAELYTASVFHLMRAVEFGLRALAAHVQVPVSPDDLEYKEWQNVIEQIEKAAKTIIDSPASSPKERAERKEFYNGVIGEFKGFKDAWRNNAMHTRATYREPQALSLFDQVKNFMRRLATRVPLT